MTIVAVIPAFNEEKAIKKVLKATLRYVDEIVVIDDGSTDSTYDEAFKIAKHVIRHVKNKGVGFALRGGIEKALQIGADWIVTLDADGEHNPQEIPRLLVASKQLHADIIVGSRFLDRGEAVSMPFFKRASNAISTIMFRIFYRVKLTDTQSGFRVYRRNVFEIIDCHKDDMLRNTEILIASAKIGLTIAEVSIVSVSSGKKFGNHQVKEIFEYPFLLLKLFGKKFP